MVTWLFSARHSLVSNYRFPSGDAAAPDLISYYSRKHLRRPEIPTCRTVQACVFACNCTHCPASRSLVRPHAVAPCPAASPSARLRLSQGVPRFLSMLVRRQHASQVHHTSHVTSLTSGMLVRRDPWRRKCAMTHCLRARVKHNLYCFL